MWPSNLCVSTHCATPPQALVQKGERRHMFSESMPADIQRSVNEENLQFMQHRDVYCVEYFDFIYRLTQCNAVSVSAQVTVM